MKAKNWPLIMAAAALLIGLVAAWNIADAISEASDIEGLIWAALMLPLSIGMAIVSVRAWRRREPAAEPTFSSDAGAGAAREQRTWRVAKWAMALSALLITVSTISWVIRSETAWTPVFTGAVALTATFILMTMLFRPKGGRRLTESDVQEGPSIHGE